MVRFSILETGCNWLDAAGITACCPGTKLLACMPSVLIPALDSRSCLHFCRQQSSTAGLSSHCTLLQHHMYCIICCCTPAFPQAHQPYAAALIQMRASCLGTPTRCEISSSCTPAHFARAGSPAACRCPHPEALLQTHGPSLCGWLHRPKRLQRCRQGVQAHVCVCSRQLRGTVTDS